MSKDYEHLPCRIAAKMDSAAVCESLVSEGILRRSDIKSMSMANVYALAAANEALNDASWSPRSDDDSERAGTCFATGMAGMCEIADAAAAYEKAKALAGHKAAYRTIGPYFMPQILANLSAGLISIKYKLKVSSEFASIPFLFIYIYGELFLLLNQKYRSFENIHGF